MATHLPIVPLIQQSSGAIALANGMTIMKLFEQLKDFRKCHLLPVLLMGYMNPVLQYGFGFCRDAALTRRGWFDLPDLPMYEFETEYGSVSRQHGVGFCIFWWRPNVGWRVKKLDELMQGFYAQFPLPLPRAPIKHDRCEGCLQKFEEPPPGKILYWLVLWHKGWKQGSFEVLPICQWGRYPGQPLALTTNVPNESSPLKQFMSGILPDYR